MSLGTAGVIVSVDVVDELVSRMVELQALATVITELASAIPTGDPESQRLHRLIFLAEREYESILSFAEGVAAGMRVPAEQASQIAIASVG